MFYTYHSSKCWGERLSSIRINSNSSFPFSQLYHGRDISIISVLSARWTFRHDRKSCLTPRRKKKRGTYIPLGSEAPWRLIRNGRWYRVENFPSNINADGVSADENRARLMREKNAVMKGDYRENRIEIPLSFPFPSLFASCPRRSFPLLNREAGDSEWSWGPAWERKKKESDLRIKYVGGMIPLVRLTPIIWPQRREGKLPVCRVVDSSMEYRNGRIDRYCKFKRIIPIHSFRSGVKVYKRKRNFAIFIDPIQLPSPDENIVSFSRIGHISSEPVTAVHSSSHRPMNAFTWPASPVYFGDNLSPSGRGNPKK